MTDQLTALRAGATESDFLAQTERHRPELLAHCYRMVGSVHDAEDLVQETYLRAWRSFDSFEGRSAVRTWLYRIATNACLTALESRSRRPLPVGLGHAESDTADPLEELDDVPWLQPLPDAATDAGTRDPAVVVAARSGLRLALIAALQQLPPRQRAVLVLRDVLRLKAAEVAGVLDTSTAAVNSSLQRARAQLGEARLREEDVAEPSDPAVRETVEAYARALERKDVPAMIELFSAEAVWEMPPYANWFRGPAAIGRLVEHKCPAGPGEMRTVPVAANGQPAFGVYWRREGRWLPFQLHVLELRRAAAGADGAGAGSTGAAGVEVTHVVSFQETALFETFGLPAELPG